MGFLKNMSKCKIITNFSTQEPKPPEPTKCLVGKIFSLQMWLLNIQPTPNVLLYLYFHFHFFLYVIFCKSKLFLCISGRFLYFITAFGLSAQSLSRNRVKTVSLQFVRSRIWRKIIFHNTSFQHVTSFLHLINFAIA